MTDRGATTTPPIETTDHGPSDRSRVWASILYLESGNLDELLDSLHGMRWAVSPLHDKDLDKEGNLKKPHYHVLVKFSSLKTREQVRDVFTGGCVGAERVRDFTAYVRYLAHLDSPDKAAYHVEDIRYEGVDVPGICAKQIQSVSVSDVLEVLRGTDIDEFCDFVDMCSDSFPEYLGTVVKNSYFFGQYLRSRSFKERTATHATV